jgi:hypothetical protein
MTHLVRFFDNGLGGKQCVTKDKIRQVSMVQRDRAQEESLFRGANSQRQPAIVFDGYSRHGQVILYSSHSNRTLD